MRRLACLMQPAQEAADDFIWVASHSPPFPDLIRATNPTKATNMIMSAAIISVHFSGKALTALTKFSVIFILSIIIHNGQDIGSRKQNDGEVLQGHCASMTAIKAARQIASGRFFAVASAVSEMQSMLSKFVKITSHSS